jgi:hypothetical protein
LIIIIAIAVFAFSGKNNAKKQSQQERDIWAEAFSKAVLGEETPPKRQRPISKPPVEPIRPASATVVETGSMSTEGMSLERATSVEGGIRRPAKPTLYQGLERITPQTVDGQAGRGVVAHVQATSDEWARILVLGEVIAQPRCKAPYGTRRYGG